MAHRPVLVIHGVANRSREKFEALVEQLGRDLALDEVKLVPVFWGDLGAALEGLEETLPVADAAAVRAAGVVPAADAEMGLGLLAGEPETGIRAQATEDRASIAGQAFEQQLGVSADLLVRAQAESVDLRSDFESAWLQTEWLQSIGNESLVREIAAAAADALAGDDGPAVASTRALAIPSPRELVGRVVAAFDRAIGSVIGSVGGEVNSFIRSELAPHLGAFIGDIFVYQAHRAEIHDRVREVLDREAPGHGDKDQPIPVLAHSLGGVISFDMAVAGDPPLSISRFVTFGSQSPFFHILDPRGGGLQPFTPGHPSPLPGTIGQWANLWEPLDPLAFIAAKVFTLADGKLPRDIAVRHLASYKLWTHSSYWHSAELVSAVREELGP
jgi:hypothetical protein